VPDRPTHEGITAGLSEIGSASKADNSRRRRWAWPRTIRLRLRLAITLLVVILGVIAGVQLVSAHDHLETGATDLGRVQSILAHNPLRTSNSRADLRAAAAEARAQFQSAATDLWLWRPALDRLSWLPAIGRELAAAWPLAQAGKDGTDAVVKALDGLGGVWDVTAPQRRNPGRLMLVRLLRPLERGERQLVQARNDLNSAWSSLGAVPGRTGNTLLDRKVAEARRYLPAARAAVDWLAAAPSLLGAAGPSHILLVFEDARELRATGGFIGAADYVTIRRGAISLRPSGSALPREGDFPLPAPESQYTDESTWLFRDSNWSPDFPLSARYERWMYGVDTGRWAPFVVDVVNAAGDILNATGPLYIPSYHRVVTSTNANAVAQHYIYDTYHTGATESAFDADRVRFLGAFATALVNRIQSLNVNALLAVGGALHSAIAQQNLLMYDRRPAVEDAINLSGAAGSIPHPAHDLLYIVDDNRSYSKLNPYVRESASYDVSIHPNLSADAALALHYRVLPSPASIEGYGPYFGTTGTKHDYQDFVRVFVPPGSVLNGSSGLDLWAPRPAYRLTQLAGRVLVRARHSATVVLRYRVPAGIFHETNGTSYVLTIAREPGTDLHAVSVTLRLPPTMAFRTARGGRSLSFVIQLDRAANSLSVPLISRKSGPIPALPPSGNAGDPYVPPGTLGDSKHPL